jgi:hypothetical protein
MLASGNYVTCAGRFPQPQRSFSAATLMIVIAAEGCDKSPDIRGPGYHSPSRLVELAVWHLKSSRQLSDVTEKASVS